MDRVDYGCLDLILEEELAMQVQISLTQGDHYNLTKALLLLVISIDVVLSFELLPESYLYLLSLFVWRGWVRSSGCW